MYARVINIKLMNIINLMNLMLGPFGAVYMAPISEAPVHFPVAGASESSAVHVGPLVTILAPNPLLPWPGETALTKMALVPKLKPIWNGCVLWSWERLGIRCWCWCWFWVGDFLAGGGSLQASQLLPLS